MVDVGSRALANGKAVSFGKLAASRLLSSTALLPAISAVATASLLLAPGVAYAQDAGAGGAGNAGFADLFGGEAGAPSDTANGADGAPGGTGSLGPTGGGGGGGAGVAGGAGGTGAGGASGGAGGAIAGGAGASGASSGLNSGGGGGGGAHGYIDIALPGAPASGGAGGSGGDTTALLIAGAGGGGGGGFGAVVTGGGALGTLADPISGGAGGAGGDSASTPNGMAGNGGNGGIGLLFTDPAAKNLTIEAAVTGGAGGAGGSGPFNARHGFAGSGGAGIKGDSLAIVLAAGATVTGGSAGAPGGALNLRGGAGGAGIVGSDITLDNQGLIVGGLGSGFFGRAFALDLSGTSTITNIGALAGGVNVASGSLTFDIASPQDLYSDLTGSGDVIKTGPGILTLYGNNGYTGLTTVSGGMLVVTSFNALGNGASGTVVENGGTLGLAGDFGIAEAITINGSGPYGAALRSLTGLNGVGGQITLGSDARIDADAGARIDITGGIVGTDTTLTLGGGGIVNIISNIATGAGGLIKDGTGTATLQGINTFTGNVFVNAGELQLVGGSALADTVLVTINAPGQIAVFSSERLGNIAGNGAILLSGGTTLTVGDATDSTFAGNISEFLGTGTLTKVGSGTLNLSGVNSYTGGTNLEEGTLGVGSNAALGTGRLTMAAGTTLRATADVTLANAISLGASATFDTGDSTMTLAGVIEDGIGFGFIGQWSVSDGPAWGLSPPNGPLAFTGQEAAAALFGGTPGQYQISTAGPDVADIDNQAWYSIIGFGSAIRPENYSSKYLGLYYGPTFGYPVLDPTAPASAYVADGVDPSLINYAFGPTLVPSQLVKEGNGTLVLQGANTYSGGTLLNAGTIRIENANALGLGDLAMAGGTVLQAGVDGLTLFNFISTSGTATIDTLANDFTISSVISGAGGITKIGSGKLTLTQAQAYAGLTTIDEGTLELTATGLITGAVNNNAIFTNAGSVGGLVTNAGTLTSTGALLGGLTQLAGADGTVRGTLNGAISNAGNLTVDGDLSSNGLLDNALTGIVTLDTGVTWSGLAGLDNRGNDANGGVRINGTLDTAGTVTNFTDATLGIFTGGTLNAGNIVNFGLMGNFGGAVNSDVTVDGGSLSNGVGGVWNGTFSIVNDGYIRNDGIWNTTSGAVSTITFGLFENFGAINGGGIDVNGLFGVLSNGVTGTIDVDVGARIYAVNGGAVINNGAVEGDGEAGIDGSIENRSTGTWTGDITVRAFGQFTNAGTVQGTGTIDADGLISNALGGEWNGAISVASGGLLENDGTITGTVTNSGTLASTGTITGTLENELGALAQLAGVVDGPVNNDGTITLTGTTTAIGAFTQGASGVFNLGDFSVEVLSLAGEGLVNLGAGRLTTGGDNSSTIFSGAITGTGGLLKLGSGTLTLSGINTFIGMTTVEAGTLELASSGELAGGVRNDAIFVNAGTVGGTIVNNGTLTTTNRVNGGLDNNAGASAAISGQINGAINNAGTITSTGGTFLGRFTQSGAGTASFTGNASLGSLAGVGPVTVTGATLTVGGDNTTSLFSGVIDGTGNLAKVGTGRLVLTGANTYAGTTSIASGGALEIGGAAGTLGGGAVTNDGLLVFSRSTAYSVANLIGGSGDLVQIGSGAVTLTGNNTYTGQTLIGPGTLIAASSTALGTAASGTTVFDGGTLGLAGGITIAGEALSLAGLGDSGTGALRNISGNNSFTGPITLAGGARIASDAGLLTLGNIVLGANTLLLSGAGDSRIDGVISGSGDASSGIALVKQGTGTATFAGVNTFTGNTLVIGGTLQLLASGEIAGNVGTGTGTTLNNAGVIRGALVNGTGGTAINTGTLAGGALNLGTLTSSGTIGAGLNNSGTLVSTGIIDTGMINSGTASIQGELNGSVLNSGTMTLTGTTTGIGVFEQTDAGTFDLGDFDTDLGGLAGAGTVDLGSATLTVGSLDVNTLFSGVIDGTGSLEKVGTGRLTLAGANTYTGGTTITGGALQLGNGGTSGSIIGPVLNEGMLIVNRSDAYTFAGVISGSGMIAQTGTGTTTLTGANTYTGGTLVTAGRLIGNTTSLQGAIRIDAPGVLEFAQGTAGTYAGSLLGTGRFEKSGAGLLTLTGNSAGLTGGTFVVGGGLRVNGDLRGSVVTVQNGATLSGTGIIGGLVAQGGSTVAPGTSPGTLTVNGNVSLAAGSTVQYEIAASAPWDRILATGTASLGGTAAFTNLSGANAYAFNSQYLLLQADGGRTGTFANATGLTGFGIIYRPEIVYTGTQAFLRFNPNLLTDIVGSTALTANQRSVVTRIDTAVTAGYNPQPLFNIYTLPNAQLPGAFDQLSGEAYATAAGVGIEQERLIKEAVLGRIAFTAAAARSDAATAKRAGAWGQVFGSWSTGQSDGNAARFTTDRTGFITGLDFGGGNDTSSWRLGVYGMRVKSDVTITARRSQADVTQSGGGIYGAFNTGGFSLALGGYLSSIDLRAFRSIALPGFAESTSGVTDGTARQAFAELSYTFGATEKSFIRPFVNATVGRFKLDAFTETGGAAALSVREQTYSTGTVTAGFDGALQVGKGFRLGATLAGRHQLGDRDPQALIALAAAPAAPFAIRAAQLDKLALAARVDATLELEENLAISIGYTGLIGDTVKDHGARATVQVRF